MKATLRATTVCLTLLAALQPAEPAAQQARQTRQRVDPMTAAIHGRVTTAGSGAPVRGAEVRLSTTSGNRRLVTTDGDGRFSLRDLPAGEYRLDVSRAGFSSAQFGQRRPFDTPAVIELSEGETFTANVVLPRGAAIYGRVVDQFGEPLAGTRVQAFRLRRIQGLQRLQTIGPGDQTDDTGAFRVYGLPPGDYYVAASVGAVDSVKRDPPVFYPGTPSFTEAQVITLAAGAEATADFQLAPVRNSRVSGVVINSAGAPIEAMVNLVSEIVGTGPTLDSLAAPTTFRLSADSGPNGAFTIDNVPPGPYTLTAMLMRREGPGIPGPQSITDLMERMPETVSTPLVVTGEDISGISLVTQRAGTLNGELVAAAGVTRPLPAGIRISSRAVHAGGVSMTQGGRGGQFMLGGMSGPFYLDIQGLPEGWMVKEISVDGVDVTDTPIDLKGRNAAARVELTDRVGSVSGVVQSQGDAAGYSVVIFPDDRDRWTYPSRYVRAARADEAGRFQITGLPPNERYLLVAVDHLESGDEQDAEILESLRGRATSLSLREGQQGSVVLDGVSR